MSNIRKDLIDIADGVRLELKSSLKKMGSLAEKAKSLTPLKKVWGDYILEKSVIIFGSPNGVGKSFLMHNVCAAISYGYKDFLLQPIELAGNTLIVNLEMSESIMARRSELLKANLQQGPNSQFEVFILTTKKGLDQELVNICDIIQRHQIKLLVIDTLRVSHIGKDFNSGSAMATIMFSMEIII